MSFVRFVRASGNHFLAQNDFPGRELDGEILDPANAVLPSGNGQRGGLSPSRRIRRPEFAFALIYIAGGRRLADAQEQVSSALKNRLLKRWTSG